MTSDAGDAEQVEIGSRAEWRGWLERHHGRAHGVWVVTWKKTSGGPYVAYEELVEEALCCGWVDSRSGRVDEERTRLWMAPRRKGSAWSRPNKERVARLTEAGLMREAGLRAVERARADGTWTALDEVEALVVPDDLATALAAEPEAERRFAAFGRAAKRGLLEWIASAKRPQTRARRIAATVEHAARGEVANAWRPRDDPPG